MEAPERRPEGGMERREEGAGAVDVGEPGPPRLEETDEDPALSP